MEFDGSERARCNSLSFFLRKTLEREEKKDKARRKLALKGMEKPEMKGQCAEALLKMLEGMQQVEGGMIHRG